MSGIGGISCELYRDEFASGEVDRLYAEHRGLFRGGAQDGPTARTVVMAMKGLNVEGTRPAQAGLEGVNEGYYSRSAGAALTHDVVDGARHELAALHPLLDVETVEAATLALTGGERDLDSLAAATVELSAMEPREIQALALSSDVSVAERRELARKGHALPSGAYPIPDKAHLHSAAVLAASGHGDVAAARKLIRKMAALFGVNIASLPGMSSADDEDLKEDASRDRRRRRHHGNHPGSKGDDDWGGTGIDTGGPSGGSGVSATRVLMRKGDGSLGTIALTGAQEDELGLAADEDDDHGYYLDLAAQEFGSAWGLPSSFRPPVPVHDVGARDDGNPTDSRTEAEVARLLKAYPGAFGSEKPHGSSARHAPVPPALRRLREMRELAGGRPQAWPR